MKATIGGQEVGLSNGRDYRVTYANNKKAGTARYTVRLLGNYKGHKALSGTFKIGQADFSKARVCAADRTYKKPGKYISAPLVSYNGVLLKKSDYTVKYYDGTSEMSGSITVAAGTARTIKVRVTGKGSYTGGTVEGSYQIVNPASGSIDLSKARIVAKDKKGGKDVSVAKQSYTGGEVTPEIRVLYKNGGTWKEAPTDAYEVSYINNVGKGSAVILVNGKEPLASGSKQARFTIGNKNMSTFDGAEE